MARRARGGWLRLFITNDTVLCLYGAVEALQEVTAVVGDAAVRIVRTEAVHADVQGFVIHTKDRITILFDGHCLVPWVVQFYWFL